MVDEMRGPTAPVSLNLARDVVREVDRRKRVKEGVKESRSLCVERLLKRALILDKIEAAERRGTP